MAQTVESFYTVKILKLIFICVDSFVVKATKWNRIVELESVFVIFLR